MQLDENLLFRKTVFRDTLTNSISTMNYPILRKSVYSLIFILSFAFTGFSQCGGLYIAGVIDGPLSGGVPKGLTVCASATITDLSIYGFGSANNGGGTDGEEYTFPSVCMEAGDCMFIASEDGGPTGFFGCAPFDVTGTAGAASINGDDAIELFCNGTVEDLFGDINVDGSGQCWDHLDGWGTNNLSAPNFGTFNCANWTFSGINALDGETSNAGATTPYPIDPCPVFVESPTCGTIAPPPGAIICEGSAICKPDVTVSINGSGCGELFASTVDAGSFGTGTIDLDLDRTRFCCEDIALGAIPVMLTATITCTTGTVVETCMSNVTVLDELAPVIACPTDKTISLPSGLCATFAQEKIPTVLDNCSATAVNNNTDPGLITITCDPDCLEPASVSVPFSFSAEDIAGNTADCNYTVTYIEFQTESQFFACNDHVNISANLSCQVDPSILAGAVLEGDQFGCLSCYDVDIENIHTTTALAEWNVTVTDPCTGNTCWGIVTVEDKTDPTIECADCIDPNVTDPDCILNCTELELFTTLDRETGVLGYDEGLLDDLIPGDGRDFIGDYITEACGAPMTASFSDAITTGACDEGSFMTRTWTVLFTRPDGSVGSLSCDKFYRFLPIQPVQVMDAEGNVTGLEAPHDTIAPGFFAPIIDETVEDVILMPKAVIEIPLCDVGTSPAEIAAFYDSAITVDRDTDDDNIDPDELDVDCVIESNEGIWYAYPHYYIQGIRPDGPHAQPIIDGKCNILVSFVDTPLDACAPGCNGNSKVLRTWTILDWCTTEFFEYNQVIKVIDDIAPRLVVAPIVESVDPWKCAADVLLPHPEHLEDSCDNELTYSIGFITGALTVTGNAVDGFIAHDVPVGETTVTYVAEDCCGNQRKVSTTITVSDNTPPVPVTIQNIVVELSQFGDASSQGLDGSAKLFASSVDNGSYDSCTDVVFEIRRDANCNVQDTVWGEFVTFCCSDLGDAQSVNIDVEMRVSDKNGNETIIWSTVLLENKAGGSGICPPDLALLCTDDIWDLDLTGTPRNFTSCEEIPVVIDTLELFENTEPRDKRATEGMVPGYIGVAVPAYDPSCGFGAIRREFDGGCTQWFVLEPIDEVFDPSTIVFPGDIEVDCDGYETGEPTWLAAACNLVGFTVESDTINFEGDACLKIVNNWTVIDWCTFDPTDTDLNNIVDPLDSGEVEGRYQRAQVIKVIDTEAPTVVSEDNLCFGVDECVSKALTLSAIGTDVGECSSAWLNWNVELDLFSDWDIDCVYSSNVASVVDGEPNPKYIAKTANGETVNIIVPSGVLPSKELHRVIWTVNDGCGNMSSETTYFTIEDKKAPTPYCLDLGTAVMTDGTVELWAIDLNQGSFDNCNANDELLFTFTDVPPPPRCDAEYDSAADLAYYNGTFWYYNASEIEEDEQECGVTGAGEYQDQGDYGGDVHRWEPGLRSSGRIITRDEVDATGFMQIPIYVWDACANIDFCLVNVRVIDNGGGAGMVSGVVQTEDAQMVENVETELMAATPGYPKFDMTDVTGSYMFDNNALTQDYEVSGVRNDDYLNGISTIDLVSIQRHILGIQRLDSPYKMIAADINADKKINGQDLVELRKLILGIYQELPQNSSWKAIDAEQTLTTANPWIYDETVSIAQLAASTLDADFIGVKIGDVNNDVVPTSFTQAPTPSKTLNLNINDAPVQMGEEVTVTINTTEALYGYQFTLNTSQVEIVEVTGVNITESNMAIFESHMTLSSHSTTAQTGDLVSITLRAKVAGTVTELLEMNSDITRAEAYVGEGLEVVAIGLGNSAAEEFSLGQNEPNPFGESTTIGYVLPEASPVKMTLYDVAGKVMRVINAEGVQGQNRLQVTKEGLTAGVIYYKIEAGQYTATRHMIVIE